MREFQTLIDRTVEQIRASLARKQAMREELLAHLWAAYEEELKKSGDRQKAADAARRRFGDASELRADLQQVVPVAERVLALFAEVFMSKWFGLIGWGVVIVLLMAFSPDNDFRIDTLIVGIIGGAGVVRLTQPVNSMTRWFGPRWGWRIIGVLFGPAVILPALAMYRDQRRSGAEVAVPVLLGVLIVGIAVVTFVYSLAQRRRQVA